MIHANKVRKLFTVSETPFGSWRIFISKHANKNVHEFLKLMCIWGGMDYASKELGGYEFDEKRILDVWNALEYYFGMEYMNNSIEVWEVLENYKPMPF